MGVDYTARKAAKKARKAEGRTSVGKRNERSDRRGGDRSALDGDDKKGKRDRPKYGRKGARRMCKGMCYGAAPLVSGRRQVEEKGGGGRPCPTLLSRPAHMRDG
jgi:hypothetical protein